MAIQFEIQLPSKKKKQTKIFLQNEKNQSSILKIAVGVPLLTTFHIQDTLTKHLATVIGKKL